MRRLAQQAINVRKHQLERNEADVHGGELRRLNEPRRIELADVGFFQRYDSRIATQPRVQLSATDIDGVDLVRAVREQHLGKAAGRRADIKANIATRIEAEGVERGDKLQRATRNPRMLRARLEDGALGDLI